MKSSFRRQKAESSRCQVSVIEPAPFQQVIKNQRIAVLAAQGDESVAVATVAGVVSFVEK